MDRLTLTQLKKRAPNLPDAELRERLRIINRLEKFQKDTERRLQSPATQRAARHILLHAKSGYDAGHECAFWDAILFCEQTGTAKPSWLSEALEKYAKDRINGRIPFKARMGRPSHPMLDAYIFSSVKYWRKQQILHGQKRRARRFSLDRAFDMVRQELAEEGLNLSHGAIRAGYKRGKKVLSTTDAYDFSPFQEKIVP